ncbi:helix-turn-helix domain-containing protein [Streptomyces rapamycinicus]|uniref:DNA-binding protein n=2 Tax=Streptomyces rapamycinicus TaxID=1226757 RepID=A0A0A0NIL3_STRRN|nr:helix-turn-helix transcriptional regulator [Streptomyces rapamycinicus]AGP57046.1 DNA-binding protein [Streptomyces rapamycinicus NRRL 5491]MBB4784679.1 transcriptional regulator with XRE-family HTH domain [Streptomyces rapamycinicus]RLV79842.1 DNA-binding protein [Streptomyces rapamycinicus NRRL 5491]UTO64957.1 helix-turn-helix transcriptional regulator [Streptomyces rapamycinicus]UTP32913.1 helix-turn-helix transcriptional regulator [Streptomyces rapamycinicus NRRL 5491]
MDETTPPAHLNPLQRFGRDVKQVRLARKLTQKRLGRAAGYSEAYVSRVEAGKLLPRPSGKFAKGCDIAFGTGELFAGMLRRIDVGDHPSWFTPYLNLERKASRVLDYSANLVIGILQTKDYAWAIFRSSHPREEAEVIEGKVAARLSRREVFELETPPLLWVILHEACLRTVVGGADVMTGQLEYLLTAAESPHVKLQVMPFSAGAPAAHAKPFTLLRFTDAPTVLYTETRVGGRMHDSAQTVASALDDYDLLRAHALSPDRSLSLIKTVSKEYRE